MPARKKKMSTSVGAGMTAKQMRRKKPYNSDMMVDVQPITTNQKHAFASYQELVGKLFGSFIQFHFDVATKKLTITQRPVNISLEKNPNQKKVLKDEKKLPKENQE